MEDLKSASLLSLYSGVRARTQALVVSLSPEDMQIQTMPDVSPTKWHLAHTTWFWETFLLRENDAQYREFDQNFNYLFNSYYNGVGERHARPERGLLSRPSLDRVQEYRAHVDAAMTRLLSGDQEYILSRIAPLVRLGLAHEEQHQELMLTDIKHVLAANPVPPAALSAPASSGTGGETGIRWIEFEGGTFGFGAEPGGFHFDNEGPRHEAILTPFALADRVVTNDEYADFIADGGYASPMLWLSDGWAMVQGEGWQSPLYWRRRDGAWHEFSLHGEHPLDPDAPVTHLSYYEASAYAEWAGARLPDEREWELAARRSACAEGRFAEPGLSAHPARAGRGEGCRQMFGDVWEWTRSAYAPYPRYRPAEGAVGEYNGKFMCGQYVLRGGSCATPPGHVRPSYRNFFPPDARWQFSGLRLAKDI